MIITAKSSWWKQRRQITTAAGNRKVTVQSDGEDDTVSSKAGMTSTNQTRKGVVAGQPSNEQPLQVRPPGHLTQGVLSLALFSFDLFVRFFSLVFGIYGGLIR